MPEISFSDPDALLNEFREKSTSYILNAIHSLEQRPHQPILPQIDRILSNIGAELAELEKHDQKRSLARQIKTYIKKQLRFYCEGLIAFYRDMSLEQKTKSIKQLIAFLQENHLMGSLFWKLNISLLFIVLVIT